MNTFAEVKTLVLHFACKLYIFDLRCRKELKTNLHYKKLTYTKRPLFKFFKISCFYTCQITNKNLEYIYMTCIYLYKETSTQVKITSCPTYRNNVSRKGNSMEILFMQDTIVLSNFNGFTH